MPDNNFSVDDLYRSYLEQTEKELKLEKVQKTATSASKPEALQEEYESSVLDSELKIMARAERRELEEVLEEFARDRKRMLIKIRRQIRERKINNEIIRLNMAKGFNKVQRMILVRDLRRLKDIDVPVADLGFGYDPLMLEQAKFCENPYCKHTRLMHIQGACMVCSRCSGFKESKDSTKGQ